MQLFLKNTFQAEKKIVGCQVKCIMKSTFSGQDHSDQLGSITISTSFTSLVDLSYYAEKKGSKIAPFFIVLQTTFMQRYSSLSSQYEHLTYQNPPSVWGSYSACFSQQQSLFRASQSQWDVFCLFMGLELVYEPLLFYSDV